MRVLSLVWGILAIVGMAVGFIPCLGALNWLNIPFAGLGAILSAVALATARPHESKIEAALGLVGCLVAAVFGVVRLILGGGVF